MLTGWKYVLSKGCIPQRYIMSIMGFFAVANAYTMRICLSIAITEMVIPHQNVKNSTAEDDNYCEAEYSNSTSVNHGEFDWDEEKQGLILSSFFWGYVITHLPGGMLAEKFGGKYSLGLGILCTAIFTLLTPLAAREGGWQMLLAVRFLEGLGEGSTFPALNALLAQWVPAQERGVLGSLVFAGAQIGTVAGTALSGVLLHYSTGNWDAVFYLFGGLGILWFIIWTLICYNDPSSHPFISDEEREFLEKTIGGTERQKELPPVPVKAMLKSVPLWGLIFAQVGHDWGFFTMVTDLPKYMKDVLKFKIAENGYLSALPYLMMWLVSLTSGWFADYLIRHGILSTTNTRKLFTTIASVGPAVFIIAASYAGCDGILVVTLFTIGMAIMGTFYPGMKVNALDLSPNYAGTLMAIVNGIGAITGIITPYLVGVLTPNSSLLEWRVVFWISFGVFFITNIIFVLTASGDVQPWNNPLVDKEEKKDHNPENISKLGTTLQCVEFSSEKPKPDI